VSVAFVLGNGLSRKPIPFDPLKKIGKVYACNAVYRSHTPDYLVAVDAKMVNEICDAGAQLRMPVWTNPNHAYKKFKGLNFFEPSLGWSSGPTALWLCCSHNHQLVYLLGFDFLGTDQGKLTTSTVTQTTTKRIQMLQHTMATGIGKQQSYYRRTDRRNFAELYPMVVRYFQQKTLKSTQITAKSRYLSSNINTTCKFEHKRGRLALYRPVLLIKV
tara:strand:- start:1272 stop:1919 length:648 start_codon:yes stop_codon:yes gene_type:complete